MIRKLALCLPMILLLSFSAEAKVLYVDGARGDDSVTYANNSSANPWRTIGRAAWGSTNRGSPNAGQAAQAGDTVHIMAGTYSAPAVNTRYGVTYNPINSGTAGNRITFEAVGTVVLTHSSGAGPSIGASSYDGPGSGPRSYITWKGFTISEQTAPGLTDGGVIVLAGGSNNTIDSCVIDGNDNGAKGNNHSGIWITEASFCTIRNSTIFNVLNFGAIHHNAGGIMSYYADDITVENNEIYNCGAALALKGGNNSRWTIRLNKLHGNGTGVAVIGHRDYADGYALIYQNLIYGNQNGIGFGGSPGDPYKRFRIVNNTFYNNSTGGVFVGWTGTPLANNLVQNNIIVDSYELINMGSCPSGNCLVPTFDFDYNTYYRSSGSTRFSAEGRAYTGLSAWTAALGGCPGTGNDCNSIASDPLFVNAAQGDFRLQASSPALSLGRDLLNLSGRGTSAIVPAGAYVAGNEVFGPGGGSPPPGSIAPPRGLRVVD